MKGIFVRKDENVIPVNLLPGEINRDRNFTSDLTTHIAKVWDGTLSAEERMDINERRYTKKLLELCKTKQFCVEHRCIELMSQKSAQLLFLYLKGVEGTDVFPYMDQKEDDRTKIIDILKKKPYKCSEALYNLLLEDSQVKTVEKAIEEAFIHSTNAPTWIQKKPMARMVMDFTTVVKEELPGLLKEVLFKSNCNLHMMIQHHNLYVNMNVVIESETIENCLQILTSIECELAVLEGINAQQKRRIAFLCKMFIANNNLHEYLNQTTEDAEKILTKSSNTQVEDDQKRESERPSATTGTGSERKSDEGNQDQPITKQEQHIAVIGSSKNTAVQINERGDNTQENPPANSTHTVGSAKFASQASSQQNNAEEIRNREDKNDQIAGSSIEVIEVDYPDTDEVLEPARKQARLDKSPNNLDAGHLTIQSKFDSLILRTGDDLELKWAHSGILSFVRIADEKKKIILEMRKEE